METGLIGLPNSGKTTIFNALTRSSTMTTAYASGRQEIHRAAVNVPDERLRTLEQMFRPRKTTHAQVIYNDLAGFGNGTAKSGISGSLANTVAANDALLLVARAFEDDRIVHPENSVHASRDLAMMESELILSDMTIIDRRLDRLRNGKMRGTADERKQMAREEDLLSRLLSILEEESPLRDLTFTAEERKMVNGFNLLSLKPMLRIVNIGDDDEESQFAGVAHEPALVIRGRLEAEIALMEAEEAEEFLRDFGIEEPGLNRAIRLCYSMLGLESFFTVGEDEVRAWTMKSGTKASEAAGLIHSDLQKGFIRAETIHYDELMACGSLSEARRMGKLRLEGKDYVVLDGDILNIRYNL